MPLTFRMLAGASADIERNVFLPAACRMAAIRLLRSSTTGAGVFGANGAALRPLCVAGGECEGVLGAGSGGGGGGGGIGVGGCVAVGNGGPTSGKSIGIIGGGGGGGGCGGQTADGVNTATVRPSSTAPGPPPKPGKSGRNTAADVTAIPVVIDADVDMSTFSAMPGKSGRSIGISMRGASELLGT